MRGDKGDPGVASSVTPTNLQPVKNQSDDLIKAPGILVQPTLRTAFLNESATFQCAPDKNVYATISWSKKGGSLPVGRHSIMKGTLFIKNVVISDSGVYICTIRAYQGTAQAAVTLNVKGKKNKQLKYVLKSCCAPVQLHGQSSQIDLETFKDSAF